MIESTVSASNMLGGIGSIAKPARKTRRSLSTGAISATGAEGISRTSRATGIRTEANVESMSDAALIKLILNGDQDVFSMLVELYKDAVQNLAYRMLGNTTEVKDVNKET